MPLLVAAFISIGLWLLFPKGFKYLVGSWVGAITGGFVWGLVELAWLVGLGYDMSWTQIAWSFIAFTFIGIIGGCFLAARG